MLPSLPEPPGIPALPVKPPPGRSCADPDRGGAGRQAPQRPPRVEGDAGYTVERSLTRGAAPPPQPGRADDFRWPRP